MNVSEAYPSRHLSATDLKGQRVTLQVASVILDKVGDDQKLVMSFVDKKKGLVLNKTNATMCAEIFNTQDTDEWTGKHLVLYPTKTDYQGRRVDCIRIDKAPKGTGKPPKPAPAPVPNTSDDGDPGLDDIPFNRIASIASRERELQPMEWVRINDMVAGQHSRRKFGLE